MTPIKAADVPTNPFARTHWIIMQLRLRETNLSKLADDNGLQRQALSSALRAPHARAEELIAEALGTKPNVLFPERFNSRGVRLYRRRDHQPRSAESVSRVAAQG